MALQFASQTDLETDLAGKDGIEAVGNLIQSSSPFDSFGYKYHQLEVLRSYTDPGGDVHRVTGLQDVIEEDDGTWGYGNNKLWNVPPTANTFTSDLKARIEAVEGTSPGGGATLLKAIILQNEPDRKTAKVEAVFDDGTTKEAYLWKDDTDTWQQRVVG